MFFEAGIFGHACYNAGCDQQMSGISVWAKEILKRYWNSFKLYLNIGAFDSDLKMIKKKKIGWLVVRKGSFRMSSVGGVKHASVELASRVLTLQCLSGSRGPVVSCRSA